MTAELIRLVCEDPEGIPRLRKLILEIAVSGRLLPALAAVAEEAGEVVSPYPVSWQATKLSRLGRWAVGSGFPTAEQGRVGLPILFCKVSDMNLPGNDRNIKKTAHTIDESAALRMRVNIHPAGTVVFPKIGGAIATNKRRVLTRPTAIDNNCLGIVPDTSVATDFLYLLLSAIDFTKYQAGTSVPALSQGVLGEISCGLPPLAEQHRIVAKVDELMALCDRLEARQQDAEAAHARLVQALLDSLTQARDAQEFQAGWERLAGEFEAVFATDSSVDRLRGAIMRLGVSGLLTADSPRSAWRTLTINEFCTVQGGIQKTPLRAPVRNHFPYLRVANVQRGRIDVSELERYELAPEELVRWRLNDGDLLIVEGNGSESEIGRCAIWRGEVADCVYQNHLMRVRPSGDDDVEYLALYLNSPVGTAHMRRLAITTSGLFNLSVGKIRSIPIELPPLSEQRRIVAKVSELLALCDQLKARIAAGRAKQAQLAEALVKQAVAAAG